MVFDFHRSCLQSAIKVHWRKPTIFGDAKIDYYLLKVSLTEHVQNILRLHLYAYYTWPLTRPKGPVLTFRTCQVTAVTPLCGSPPPPTHPTQKPPFPVIDIIGISTPPTSCLSSRYFLGEVLRDHIQNDSLEQPASSFGFSSSLS